MVNVTCQRCHKSLSNPKSIERGYGPVCAKKLGIALRSNRFSLSLLTKQYEELKLPTLEEYFTETSDTKNV